MAPDPVTDNALNARHVARRVPANPPPLAHRLAAAIAAHGPMCFAAWMQACLYDPRDGYYMKRRSRIGTDAASDFATAPELHPFLGQAVAAHAVAVWQRLGRPPDFAVAEFGGGTGSLARAALGALDAGKGMDDDAPEARAAALAWRWIHIEASPSHRRLQAGDPRVAWADALPPGFVGLVVANEFLDALPVHWLVWRGAWREVRVDRAGAGDTDAPPGTNPVFGEVESTPCADAVAHAPTGTFADGQRAVAPVAARAWLARLAKDLRRGDVLLIDYGDTARELWVPERADGTVRGFAGQRLVEDVLAAPGDLDITSSVDWTQVAEWAKADGFEVEPLQTQATFLMRHGAIEALAAAPRDTLEQASDYLRLRQLVLGMGGHHVLVLRRP